MHKYNLNSDELRCLQSMYERRFSMAIHAIKESVASELSEVINGKRKFHALVDDLQYEYERMEYFKEECERSILLEEEAKQDD